MTNRQWLMEQIQNMSDEKLCDFDVGQMICEMLEADACKEVHSDCRLCKTNWLKAEYKEPIKISDAERVILENVDKEFKWISRDKDGSLYVSKVKPSKDYEIWQGGESEPYVFYNHLFQFITWEDKQAYNIQELLEG